MKKTTMFSKWAFAVTFFFVFLLLSETVLAQTPTPPPTCPSGANTNGRLEYYNLSNSNLYIQIQGNSVTTYGLISKSSPDFDEIYATILQISKQKAQYHVEISTNGGIICGFSVEPIN